MENASIKLSIRLSSGESFDVEIGAKATVKELKD
jgi:hypothetical protein